MPWDRESQGSNHSFKRATGSGPETQRVRGKNRKKKEEPRKEVKGKREKGRRKGGKGGKEERKKGTSFH